MSYTLQGVWQHPWPPPTRCQECFTPLNFENQKCFLTLPNVPWNEQLPLDLHDNSITQIKAEKEVECLGDCMHVTHAFTDSNKLEKSHPPIRLPQWFSGKESACNAGDAVDWCSIPGSGRSPGGRHGHPLQYSCLENPMERAAWWATVHRAAKSQTQLKQLSIHSPPNYLIRAFL